MRRYETKRLTRIPRYQLTPYQHWYRETWPHHILADPEAQSREKRMVAAVQSVATMAAGLFIVASLVSKHGSAKAALAAAGEALAGVVDKAKVQTSDSDTSPASDTTSVTGSVTSPSLTEQQQ